jgi:hypothetical protein
MDKELTSESLILGSTIRIRVSEVALDQIVLLSAASTL